MELKTKLFEYIEVVIFRTSMVTMFLIWLKNLRSWRNKASGSTNFCQFWQFLSGLELGPFFIYMVRIRFLWRIGYGSRYYYAGSATLVSLRAVNLFPVKYNEKKTTILSKVGFNPQILENLNWTRFRKLPLTFYEKVFKATNRRKLRDLFTL